MYSFHRAANSIGAIAGLLIGAGLAQAFDWRVPFLVFAAPTLVLVVLGLRLTDPGRGHFERAASNLGTDTNLEEPPPSYAEALRMVWTIRSLRRIFMALPFLAASFVVAGKSATGRRSAARTRAPRHARSRAAPRWRRG